MFFPQYIAVDELNQAHITGATQVIDYPMVNPIQGSAPGGINIYVSILKYIRECIYILYVYRRISRSNFYRYSSR